MKSLLSLAAVWVAGFVLAASVPVRANTPSWPALDELQAILRAERPDLPAPGPEHTDAESYLRSLAPDVVVDEKPGESGPPVGKAQLYLDGMAYLRVRQVEASLPGELSQALDALRASNQLSGVVLDLRYARGSDFDAAFAAAGLFNARSGQGFRLGERRVEIPAQARSPSLPVMVLVNRATQGAAEALAAAVRHFATVSLLLGNNTAGQARIYRNVELPGGRNVQVAVESLVLPGDRPFPKSGLSPDLLVPVLEADEALYYADEYSRVVRGRRLGTNFTFRLNEAELVRRRRGLRPPPKSPDAERPVADPVLARGLDILSGLATLSATDAGRESR